LEKILDIVDLLAYEKDLKIERVKEAVKTAMVKTAKKALDSNLNYEADFDEKAKTLKLFQLIKVVAEDDERLESDPENYISLSEAKEIGAEAEIGDELKYELSLDNMSRTATNTLHKELEFHIQKVIEDQLFDKFKARIGKIVNGPVVRVDSEDNTFVEIDEVRAIMPLKNRIKGEKFKVGEIVRAVLKNVRIDKKHGIYIELSRTTPKYLEELLHLESPEIKDGEVVIERCARIPGERAKVAVSSQSPKIDPVGATVGVKGVRINAVSKELKNESIDCIEYSPIPEMFVHRALSPALIKSVKIEDNRAVVTITSDQKPKAIGKNGINIRLASMLTGYEIELIEVEGAPVVGESGSRLGEGQEEKKDLSSLKLLFKD